MNGRFETFLFSKCGNLSEFSRCLKIKYSQFYETILKVL